MRLLIIRHGDPDYSIDSLTEHGWEEAKILATRISKLDVKNIYVSPLGRARDTASFTLKAMNREAEVCDWMREFPAVIEYRDNETLRKSYPGALQKEDGSFYSPLAWDMLPSYWTKHEDYYDKFDWRKSEVTSYSDIIPCYDYVTKNFDALLAKHGYQRENNYYRVTQANKDTLVFFCHFGLACVLLSHLMGVSPYPLWQGVALAPASVTTIYTEEREKGIAIFRATQIGDISHLYAAGMEPSFHARFCEIYDDFSERH